MDDKGEERTDGVPGRIQEQNDSQDLSILYGNSQETSQSILELRVWWLCMWLTFALLPIDTCFSLSRGSSDL